MYKVFLSSQINTTEWETVTLRAKNTEHTGRGSTILQSSDWHESWLY